MDAARRELIEETGWDAGRIDVLLVGPTSSGMLTLHCPPAQLYGLSSFLRQHGADTVSVVSLDYVMDRENPLFAKLAAFLQA